MKKVYYKVTPIRKRIKTDCVLTTFKVASGYCRFYCDNFGSMGQDLQGNDFVFCKDKKVYSTMKPNIKGGEVRCYVSSKPL